LKELASSLGLEENVVFLGYRSRKELLELYNFADLFVLASYSEGLPFVLLEAMACENICVSTPVGDVRKIIREGDNGFLMKIGDSMDLAKKMWEILSLPEEQASRIRTQARKTIETEFDLRKITEKMIWVVSTRAPIVAPSN
jgi:glycosyltransferase involved in cell wall biosynthesis